jgi:hypothetical protein
MSASNTITLNGTTIEVRPIPLGRLRVLIPAFNRAGLAFAAGALDEKAIDDTIQCIAAGCGLSVEQVEGMSCTMPELIAALEVIAEVAGIKPKEEEATRGNLGATGSTGTTSTPT